MTRLRVFLRPYCWLLELAQAPEVGHEWRQGDVDGVRRYWCRRCLYRRP